MRPVDVRPRAVARLASLVALGLLGALLSVVPAQAAVAFSTSLINGGNGNCVTVPGGAGTSALQLAQSACGAGASQSFTFTPVPGSNDAYTVRTLTSGSCVDVSGAATADNAAVIQYACHSGSNQQFRLQAVGANFSVVAVGSGKCVAPAGDNPAGGAALVQLPCTTAASRVWRLPGYNPGTQDPQTGTVRVFLLRPSDVPYDQRYPDGIAAVMREAQRYYQQELGRTFRLNSVLGAPDRRWINVGEVIAEGPGAGGGGGNGWVILCQHDADGAAGLNGPMNRWYGGMVHELGHAFGLPDSTYTDGTPMSASFYDYPNTHFNQSQKTAILNGPYGTFLS